MLLYAQKGGAALDYIMHITRGADNVATHTVQADSDVQAFDLAIEWAASLLLAADDDVVLAIRFSFCTPLHISTSCFVQFILL